MKNAINSLFLTIPLIVIGQTNNIFPSSGNAGVGTTSPASKFHVYNGSSGKAPHGFSDLAIEDDEHVMLSLMTYNTKNAYYGFADNDDDFVGGIQYDHPNDRMYFRVNNHNYDMVINKDGNVGIGTTTPTANFEVYKYDGVSHARIYTNQHAGTATLEIAGGVASFGSQYSGWNFYHSYNNTNKDLYLRHGQSGNPNFVFTDSGQLGVGTSQLEAVLDVEGSMSFLTGAERMLWSSKHAGTTDHRNYLAPRKADDTGWDWGEEFGHHFYHRAWYFDSKVGIGTWNPGDYKLAVKGKIRAEEVKVETGWADYVFQEGYDLPTLEEVEQHIQEKGHLINIPSAQEVAEHGVQLGEMNKLLLEKIEELTLYVIDLKKAQEQLQKENRALKETLTKIIRK